MLGWLQNGDLKRETESLIVAAQNQSIRTTLVKAKIDRRQGDSLCRMCRKVDESIDHIVNGCCRLAQKEYKRSHDNLGKILHWSLLESVILKLEINGMNMSQKVWNFSTLTDYVIEAWRPDLAVADKKERSCKIIILLFLELVGLRRRRKIR